MASHIPALYSEGRYTFRAPFDTVVVPSDVILKCMAIRSFDDVYNEGIDVFKAYYQPHTINESDFTADRLAKVCILTFTKVDGTFYQIPSSYVLQLPSGDTVPYCHLVLSISFGAIPDALDLNAIKTALAATASDVIGVVPTVVENKAPTIAGSVVTEAQHVALEIAREAAIEIRTTDRSENIRLNTLVGSLNATIAELEAYIIANMPPP